MLLGKQAPVPLSNPIRFFTQKYINVIARDSNISKEKRQLLFRHLIHYINRIPLYLKRQVLITKSRKTQATSMMEKEADVVKGEPKKSRQLGPQKVPLKEKRKPMKKWLIESLCNTKEETPITIGDQLTTQ